LSLGYLQVVERKSRLTEMVKDVVFRKLHMCKVGQNAMEIKSTGWVEEAMPVRTEKRKRELVEYLQ